MNSKIVVVGSANTDMVLKVKHLPEPGETVLGGEFITTCGGKGANQAVAAARLGAEVTFVARLGRDVLGESAVAAYKAENIRTEFIARDDQTPSGVALILVDNAGENIIAVAPGANAKLSPQDILAAKEAIQDANCLLVQLEIPLETVQAAIQLANQHKVPVILNPAPATRLPAEILNRVDYLTPNQMEAIALADGHSTSSTSMVAMQLYSEFRTQKVIITLGRQGAMLLGFHNDTIPGYVVNAVDTTGAGDAFNGGLAVALARGTPLRDAVVFANAVAALSTTRPGAQTSMPTLEEVNAFLGQSLS